VPAPVAAVVAGAAACAVALAAGFVSEVRGVLHVLLVQLAKGRAFMLFGGPRLRRKFRFEGCCVLALRAGDGGCDGFAALRRTGAIAYAGGLSAKERARPRPRAGERNDGPGRQKSLRGLSVIVMRCPSVWLIRRGRRPRDRRPAEAVEQTATVGVWAPSSAQSASGRAGEPMTQLRQ
jgi:hypothetical protein